ncbi:MAG: hypothetical protein K6F50_02660 [Kiritimatiellae bacterium]|nr:hypothetical protein [Kiritimatiellia bacterium]
MKHAGIFAAAIGAALWVAPAGAVKVNLGGSKPAAEAEDGETVKIVARGVGVDEVSALKDAYRDAVERAVGLYVDAEAMAQNDEVVSEQVLTQSNAYVTDYKKIESKPVNGGLVQVRIVATVKKQALSVKLRGVMPAEAVAVDSSSLKSAFAQMASKEKMSGDAAELLRAALKDVSPVRSLVKATLRPDTQQLLEGDTVRINNEPLPPDKVVLKYIFELKLDQEKYFSEFVPHLKKTLDQISLVAPKEVRLTELVAGNDNYHDDLSAYKEGREGFCYVHSAGGSLAGFYDGIHVYSTTVGGGNMVWDCELRGMDRWAPPGAGSFSFSEVSLSAKDFNSRYTKSKVVFVLVTKKNRATVYELDKKVIDVLNDWIYGQTGLTSDNGGFGRRGGRGGRFAGKVSNPAKMNYSVVLLDEAGEEIGAYPWEVPVNWLINLKVAEIPNAGMVYCTPLVGCLAESYIEWRSFVLEKDQLPKISEIKVELAE